MRKDIRNKALRRLKILEGQVRGVARLVEEEKYCVDIITQIEAVKKALSSVEHVILENHLATHVVEQIRGGKHGKALDEIMKVYKLSQKNN